MAFTAAAQAAQNIGGEVKKPLLQKKPLMLKKDGQTTTEAPKLEKKPAPLLKKAEPKVEPVEVEESVSVIETKVEQVLPKAETKVTEAEVKEEKEIETKVEPVADKKTETKATEEKKEEKPKRTRTKKDTTPTTASMPVAVSDMTFEEALEKIKSTFVDDEWDNKRNEIIDRINDIVIPSDANSSVVRNIIEQLNSVKNEIWADAADAEAVFENVCELIDITRTLYGSGGSNEQARKKSGVEACMNFKDADGQNVNLFEVRAEARMRYMFYKGAMMKIKSTHDLLVGIQAMLKVEKSVLGGEA